MILFHFEGRVPVRSAVSSALDYVTACASPLRGSTSSSLFNYCCYLTVCGFFPFLSVSICHDDARGPKTKIEKY